MWSSFNLLIVGTHTRLNKPFLSSGFRDLGLNRAEILSCAAAMSHNHRNICGHSMLFLNLSLSCCRCSSPQCSREEAVRFTSWLLDRTLCSAGNDRTCELWDQLVMSAYFILWLPGDAFLYLCRLVLTSMGRRQGSTKFSWMHHLCLVSIYGSTVELTMMPAAEQNAWIHRPIFEFCSGSSTKFWTSLFPLLSTEESSFTCLITLVIIWSFWLCGKFSWTPDHWSTSGLKIPLHICQTPQESIQFATYSAHLSRIS